MDITPIDDEISKENELLKEDNQSLKKEIESLKKENESLKKEIKLLKEKNSDYKIKIDTLLPGDLFFKKGNSTDEYISIEKGGIQYVLYLHYDIGNYLIIYNGENLLNTKFDVFDNGLQFFFFLKLLKYLKQKSFMKFLFLKI